LGVEPGGVESRARGRDSFRNSPLHERGEARDRAELGDRRLRQSCGLLDGESELGRSLEFSCGYQPLDVVHHPPLTVIQLHAWHPLLLRSSRGDRETIPSIRLRAGKVKQRAAKAPRAESPRAARPKTF